MINAALNRTIGELRTRGLRKRRSKSKVRYWKEEDYLDGPAKAGVVLIPTRGCSWGLRSGCAMCGYVYDSGPQCDEGALLKEFEDAAGTLKGVEYIKIFNSGSFFDAAELSPSARSSILRAADALGPKRIQVESRPEFIAKAVLEECKGIIGAELEVALGLETSNDAIRRDCINKNATFADYTKAIKTCVDIGALPKAYVLLKPPFLTEKEAVEDAIKSSVDAVKAGASRISINPVNVQGWTLVEHLWRKSEYRPPWLWSVVKVLKETKASVDVPVISHPTAAGKIRGPHNCGACDAMVAKAIRDFSTSQDLDVLSDLECGCIDAWKEHLHLEQLMHCALA